MIINFNEIPESVMKNLHGGEKEALFRAHADDMNRVLLGKLGPGASIGPHRHEDGSEAIYILQGSGEALYDGEREELRPGSCHYCSRGHSHSLINGDGEDMIFFAVIAKQP